MKVAFMSEENRGLDSIVSHRFGRAKYMIIVDVENGEVKSVKAELNPGGQAASGAGIKAVQKLVDEGVEAVVAGAFGPNAMTALENMGVKYYQLQGVTVREALGKLSL